MLLLLSLAVAINAAEVVVPLRSLGRWENGPPTHPLHGAFTSADLPIANSRRTSESSDDESTRTGPPSSRHSSEDSSSSDPSQKSWSSIVRKGSAGSNSSTGSNSSADSVKRVECKAECDGHRDEVAGLHSLVLRANEIFIDGNNCMQSEQWRQGGKFIEGKPAFYKSEGKFLRTLNRARVHAHKTHVVFDGKSDQKQREEIAQIPQNRRANFEVTWAVDSDSDGMAEWQRTADDKIVFKVRQFRKRALRSGYNPRSKPTLLLITNDRDDVNRRDSLVSRVEDAAYDESGRQVIEVMWKKADWLVGALLEKAQK